jgi:hypothetical protein
MQHLSYERQLTYKADKVKNCLQRIGGISAEELDEKMEPIIGMEEPFYYRNKAQFPIGKDKDGNIVVTKLDEKVLESVAVAGNGAYIRASNSEFGLNPIISELKDLEAKRYESVVFEDFDEQYMYFFGIALFFLLLEFLVGSRRVSKRMFAIILALMVCTTGAFAQTDKKEVRKGNRFFKKEQYKESEVEYRKALLKDSLSLAGNYNLANTLVKQNDAAGAENFYGKLSDSVARIKNEVDWELSAEENPTFSSDFGSSFLSK